MTTKKYGEYTTAELRAMTEEDLGDVLTEAMQHAGGRDVVLGILHAEPWPDDARSVEASELGLTPGDWPLHVWHDHVRYMRTKMVEAYGDLVSVEYTDPKTGTVLTVWND